MGNGTPRAFGGLKSVSAGYCKFVLWSPVQLGL